MEPRLEVTVLYALAESTLLAYDGANWSALPLAASLAAIGRPTHVAARDGLYISHIRNEDVLLMTLVSILLGGIVTDPALMVIPFDDHMVHRGHGIFDTAAIANGRIYDLEAHLEEIGKTLMIKALERTGGVQTAAAELLGTTRDQAAGRPIPTFTAATSAASTARRGGT